MKKILDLICDFHLRSTCLDEHRLWFRKNKRCGKTVMEEAAAALQNQKCVTYVSSFIWDLRAPHL